MNTFSVLLSEPYALFAIQVKLPMSDAWIWPMKNCEVASELVILYLECPRISRPLCNQLNFTGKLPLLIVHVIAVRSPIAILGGTDSGFRIGVSEVNTPKKESRN